MIKLIKIIPLLYCLIFTSCINNALDDVLFRTINDPFYDTPVLDFLSEVNTIKVSWKKDDGADIYILLRAKDSASPDFKEIYRGTDTEYIDTNLPQGEKYLYKLDKKRGNTPFYAKKYAGGASFSVITDSCGNNNKSYSAAFLEYEKNCNIHSIIFDYSGPEFENQTYAEEDWFYISIPPMRSAQIIVTQTNLEEKTTQLLRKIGSEDSPEEAVQNGKAFPIDNNTFETKLYYFYIKPSLSSLRTNGANVINYNIYLSSIVPYTHN